MVIFFYKKNNVDTFNKIVILNLTLISCDIIIMGIA